MSPAPHNLRRGAAGAVLIVLLVSAAVALLGSGGAGGPGGRARHLYVDCSQRAAGDGTRKQPWNSLAQANRALLSPGSWLMLRRGTACRGFLAPSGSGSSALPILIGAYGRGPLPRIVTAGLAPDALRLTDAYVIVQDLDLSNRGDYSSDLRGVHVVAVRPGTVHDIVLRRLYVHDVLGNDTKGLMGSGGIQVDGLSARILIQGNLIEDVNRSGIWVAGTGQAPRPPAALPWLSATTGVVIDGNTIRRVGGDGIVPSGTVGAVVADNVICCGNLRGRPGRQSDAGIWTFDANGTLIERNVVYEMANPRADGTAYDVDYNQDGTIVRSNYGYRNAGGFILLCTTGAGPRTADVAFNLSVEEYVYDLLPCGPQGQRAGSLAGVRVYNNTFLTQTTGVWHNGFSWVASLPPGGELQFFNNIVAASTRQRRPFPCDRECSHNLFWRLPRSGSAGLVADPRFVGGGPASGDRLGLAAPFRLRPGSPALGAGAAPPPGVDPDYFGDRVPSPPSIGFDQRR